MHPLERASRRALLRLEDWARTRGLSGWLAAIRLAYTFVFSRRTLTDAIAHFLVSNPGAPWRGRWTRAGIRAARRLRVPPADAPPVRETILDSAIIAKAPESAAERGILFVLFERELRKLIDHPAFSVLEAEYQIVFLPSWLPVDSRELLLLAARATRPFVILPARAEDSRLDPHLGPLCIPLPLHAASWIPAQQFPVAQEKNIDLIMIANFSKYKRHWKLFEALHQLGHGYRTVCAGRPWLGRDQHTLRREATAFGVADQIEFIPNPSDAEVAQLLARSWLFCAMSHKEGSFIAAAEAMIAGTAVGMFAHAIIGSKQFVNEQTGFLFDAARPLGPQLRQARARAAALQPDRWAREHISADASIRRFNADMRRHSERLGLAWTTDAAPVYCRNFAFCYTHDADAHRFAPEYARLQDTYHIRFRR